MTGSAAWEDDIVHGFKALTSEDVPGLEIMLIDAVADWLFSDANPGDGYGDEHAGHMVSTLFSAVESARTFQPAEQPEVTDVIAAARTRLVEGAHELANNGWPGVSLTVSRLMPAMLAELQDNAGERGKQLHGVFVYLLYAVAAGTRDKHEPAVLEGLAATLVAWDTVLRGGYTVPWRKPPG
ncbi:MAG: hypothetical protein QOG20_548 [Pseudonocardiales bacterium]|jgi:hypothetical protein|nr:hypothetical protein [Pseudonocardiales bacterium]